MTEPWAASMSGAPWTTDKRIHAIVQLRNRGSIDFVVGIDTIEDLVKLDEQVFSKRPDLILNIYDPLENDPYSEIFMQALAHLKHVIALKISIKHRKSLHMLSELSNLDFLYIRSLKKQNLDFIRAYKKLTYLYLSGSFEDLSPIADCMSLHTLVLNSSIANLDFISNLPMLTYLSIDSCTLSCSLDALSNSSITMLKLSSVRKLTSIAELEHINSLTYLHLALPKVEKLCNFSRMKNLKQLELYSMTSLNAIDPLWSAKQIEVLELRELNKRITAESLSRITEMDHLRQIDFRFIDFNKNRITALRKQMIDAGKEQLLVENIDEKNLIPSIALSHLSRILM